MTDLQAEGAAGWEAIADGWTERMRTGTDDARRFVLDQPHLKLLGDVAGKRVLDAGCGEGRFARMLAGCGAKVIGVDLSVNMIRHARAMESEVPLDIDYFKADICDLSRFTAESFDAAVAYLSILDVLEYRGAIREIARVIAPGSQFLFSVVHPCFNPPGAAWEPRKPGTIPIFDKDKLFKKIDNYLPARELRFRMWPTAPTDTVNFHRPLADYSRAVRDAGMLIREIVEPVPSDEVMKERDYLREHERVPYYIIFDCVKLPR